MSRPEINPSPRAIPRRALLLWGVTALCAGLLWINFDKGAWWGIQGWGRPYWWLDYSHGFVRRGLMGQLFQMRFGRLDEAAMAARVAVIHRLLCLGLAGMSLFLLVRALQAQRSAARFAVVGAVGVWLVVGDVWPTLAYNQGYLDVVVLDVAVGAALLMRRGWTAPAAVLAFIGPFIHEYFLFLTPFVLASHKSFGAPPLDDDVTGGVQSFDALPDRFAVPAGVLIVGAAALVATLIAALAPNMKASATEIASMPLSPEDREILVRTTMGQTFSQSLNGSAGLLFGNFGFVLKNFAFFLAPAAVAVAALAFWRRPPIALGRWVRVAAALAPLAALLVAWDLSRLTVNAGLTAGLLLLMTAEDDPGGAPEGAATPALIGAAVLGLLGAVYALAPMAYVYYPPGPTTLFPLRVWPGDGQSVPGVAFLWPGAQTRRFREAGHIGAGDLVATRGSLLKDGQGWRVPAGPDGLLFTGPYAQVGGGSHRARLHMLVDAAPDACRATAAALRPRFTITAKSGRKALAVAQPAQVAPDAANPCSLTLISPPFAVGLLGEREVETPLSLNLTSPAVVDRYALEPAAQSR